MTRVYSTCSRLTVPYFMESLDKLRCGRRRVAFFTMEAYDGDRRPGGGGLGTLSADYLAECADQGLPIIGVTLAQRLIHQQKLNPDLWQEDVFTSAKLEENPALVKLPQRINLEIQGKNIPVDLWGKLVYSWENVPVIGLSTADCGVPGFERITDKVYPGSKDPFATLGQEIVLGIGGVKALKALGIMPDLYHFNDGHPALGAAQILRELDVTPENFGPQTLETLRSKLAYTSHTLVGAASDVYVCHLVSSLITDRNLKVLIGLLSTQSMDGNLRSPDDPSVLNPFVDMVKLAMFCAGRINAVSQLNASLLKATFSQHTDRISGGITNAVHPDWAAPPIENFYNKIVPGWQKEPGKLCQLESLKSDSAIREQFWGAHMEAKLALLQMITRSKDKLASAGLDPNLFCPDLTPNWLTVGFARRVAGYKRHDLLVHDLNHLVSCIAHARPIQFVFAGKAHPMDGDPGGGKYILQSLLRAGRELNQKYKDKIKFVFLPDYDVEMARTLIPGVDLWMNNPIWGQEASGTSPMVAAVNAVLLLSTDDGCIPEMRTRGNIGWVFGAQHLAGPDNNYAEDSAGLYSVLPAISDVFYGARSLWIDKMFDMVTRVVPYFLTPRAIKEYRERVWGFA